MQIFTMDKQIKAGLYNSNTNRLSDVSVHVGFVLPWVLSFVGCFANQIRMHIYLAVPICLIGCVYGA